MKLRRLPTYVKRALAAQAEILGRVEELAGPAVADALQTFMVSVEVSGGTAAVIGVILLFWTASSLFLEMQRDLNDIFDVPQKEVTGVVAMVRLRGVGFLWVLGLGFLLGLPSMRIRGLYLAVLTLAFAVPGAYAVARLRFPGRSLVVGLFAAAIVTPGVVIAFGLLSVWGRSGWASQLAILLTGEPLGVSIFGLGGILAAHRANGDPVTILTLTSGAVGGDSAGANLAAVVALTARDRGALRPCVDGPHRPGGPVDGAVLAGHLRAGALPARLRCSPPCRDCPRRGRRGPMRC